MNFKFQIFLIPQLESQQKLISSFLFLNINDTISILLLGSCYCNSNDQIQIRYKDLSTKWEMHE